MQNQLVAGLSIPFHILIKWIWTISLLFLLVPLQAQVSKEFPKDKLTYLNQQLESQIRNYYGLMGNLIGNKLQDVEKVEIKQEIMKLFISQKIRVSNDLLAVARKDLSLTEYFDYFSQYSGTGLCDIAVDSFYQMPVSWNSKDKVFTVEVRLFRSLINSNLEPCNYKVFKTSYCSFFFRVDQKLFNPKITSFQTINGLPRKKMEEEYFLTFLPTDININGAEVSIDNVVVGTLPLFRNSVSFGRHNISIRKPGYRTLNFSKTVISTSEVQVSMVKKSETFAKVYSKVKSNGTAIGITLGIFLFITLIQP